MVRSKRVIAGVFAKNSIGHTESELFMRASTDQETAEWTRSPHLMGSGVWDTPVLACAESSRNGIDSGWGETPFLSENKPSRRLPLVPGMESTNFRKSDNGTELRRLNGA